MKANNTLRLLLVLSIWFFLTGCDHGSKKVFSEQIRAAGHFEKK